MSSKNSMSQRSCSAVLTTYGSRKNSTIVSLSNFSRRSASYTRRPLSVSESKSAFRTSMKNFLNKDSCLNTKSSSKFGQKEKKQPSISSSTCYCSDRTASVDESKQQLTDLEDQLKSLTLELIKEKDSNHVLRRDFLMAKKVLKREIGSRCDSFDDWIKNASKEGWKGRQEIIIDLRRRLRILCESVLQMESAIKPLRTGKTFKPKPKVSSDVFPNERKVYWCMELERQQVLKNIEKYKKANIASRDSLKNALESLIDRNEEMENERIVLRQKLDTIPINLDEKILKDLEAVENKLKTNIDGKVKNKHELDNLEQKICRKCRNVAEMGEKIDLETKNGKDKEEMLYSLKSSESKLRRTCEELSREKCKQATEMKKKLDEVEKEYSKIVMSAKKTVTTFANSKRQVEKLKVQRRTSQITNNMDNRKVIKSPNKKDNFNESPNKLNNDYDSTRRALLRGDSASKSCKYLLYKYQKKLDHLERRNLEKLEQLRHLTNKTEESSIALLKNGYILTKLEIDIHVSKKRAKKARKVIANPSKLKLVKKKNSSQNLNEILDEEQAHLKILKTESKILKTLVRHIFASAEGEWDLFETYLMRLRESLLKKLPS